MSNASAQYRLGKIYLTKKQYDDAINAFQTAVMSEPTNIEAYNDIGKVYLAKGMKKEAEDYFGLYNKQVKTAAAKAK